MDVFRSCCAKLYGDYSGLPAAIVRRVREFIPKDTMAPDRIVGMDQIIADAQRLKFIAEPLKPEQLREFVQIPVRSRRQAYGL